MDEVHRRIRDMFAQHVEIVAVEEGVRHALALAATQPFVQSRAMALRANETGTTSASLSKNDLYAPTLRALRDLGGSGSVDEINQKILQASNFADALLEATYEKSGGLVVPDKMSWARSYLKNPGFVANSARGVWVLTEAGRAAAELNNQEVFAQVRAATTALRTQRRNVAQGSNLKPDDPDAEQGSAESEGGDWSDQLLAKLQSIDPSAFERLCQRLLRENGFIQVEVTGKSGDGGIDGKGVLRVNLVSFQVLFQCKRYQGSVGSGAVRDFRGAMQGRADKGLIITTGGFTPDARKEATRDGAPAIDLVDGDTLCQLLRDQTLGVRVRQVEEITVDHGFFDEI